MDNLNWKPCHQTAFTTEYQKEYEASIPFFEHLDSLYLGLCPRQHASQIKEASKTNFRIGKTSFSTVTINHNFQTRLHKDRGNFKDGFALLTVLGNSFTGGYLILPQYKIAFDIRERDLLCLNVNEWHCNSPITITHKEGYRVSIVCYLREFISKCELINSYNQMTNGMTQLEIIQQIIEAISDKKLKGNTIKDMIRYTGKFSRGNKPEFVLETKWMNIAFRGSAFHILDKKNVPPKKFTSLARAFMEYVKAH
jgi:hypothetical protein